MKKQNGFTLIELIITLIIFGTVLSVAVPRLTDLLERKSQESIVPILAKSIEFARDKAATRRLPVQIVPVTLGNDWSQGWTVQYQISADTVETISNFEAVPGNPIFTSTQYSTTAPLIILPTGIVNNAGAFQHYYPGCTGNNMTTIQVLISGLVQEGVAACPITTP